MSRTLSRTPVLLIDCQSTGANPSRGHLLEIAWCRTTAEAIARNASSPVTSHLVALPDGERIPRRITRMTGIGAADLAGAQSRASVRAALRAALAPDGRGGDTPLVVAHFARFERAFVEHLFAADDAGMHAIDWICTHEIVCRLLPDLPHRGLRAVAGRLGRVVAESKRAGEHVTATAVVWSGLVRRLAEDADVATEVALRSWLESTPAVRRVGRGFTMERAARLGLPDAPGVYRMLGARRRLLYVGKATSLRRRVNSYFQKRRHAAPRTLEMLTQVVDVAVTPTGSALEAALLEADLIKERAPPYNVALRDRGGDVAFGADDLAAVETGASASHRLGPIMPRETLDAWVALRELLAAPERATEETFVRALGLFADVRLDMDCARAGLHAFADDAALPNDGRALRRRLMGLGARAWREHQEALAAAAAAADAESLDEDGSGDSGEMATSDDSDDAVAAGEAAGPEGPREPWAPSTPEQVALLLRDSMMHGARMVRRGRFLAALTEASLVWRPPAGDTWRGLEIAGGRIVESADVAPGTAAPVPPDHARDGAARRSVFDVPTFDRLRVLTTELRRLVAAGVPLELCLGPRHRLNAASLARRLFWV